MPLPYRSYDELSNYIRSFFINQMKVSTEPMTISRSLMDIMTDLTASVYSDMNSISSMFNIELASGEDLDRIAKVFDLTRRQSTVAYDNGQNVRIIINTEYGYRTAQELIAFYNDTVPLDLTISSIHVPAGTILSDIAKHYTVATTQDITFNDTDTEKFVTVRGTFGSSNMGPHTITTVNPFGTKSLEKYLKADNLAAISGAQGEETDEDFRYRIINAIYIGSKCNQLGIEDAAMQVPSISDVMTSNNRYGIGTFEIFITSTNAIVSAEEIQAVEDNVEEYCAMGTRPIVVAPKYVGVYIRIRLKFDENHVNTNDYLTIAQQTLSTYINNLDAGETLYIENIENTIKSISPSILNVYIEQMGIGEYIPELGNKNEITNIKPISNGDLECDYNEKFVTGLAVLKVEC